MEQVWIWVYRDTFEEVDMSLDSNFDNLAKILVAKKLVQTYFDDCKKNTYWDNVEEFLDDYVADDTEDFYAYALKHNAIIDIKRN
jgi:hypothetical protein